TLLGVLHHSFISYFGISSLSFPFLVYSSQNMRPHTSNPSSPDTGQPHLPFLPCLFSLIAAHPSSVFCNCILLCSLTVLTTSLTYAPVPFFILHVFIYHHRFTMYIRPFRMFTCNQSMVVVSFYPVSPLSL